MSFHSCYNTKTSKVREPKPRADEIVVKHLYFTCGTGYIIGFGTGFDSACLSLKQEKCSFHSPTPLSGIYRKELI